MVGKKKIENWSDRLLVWYRLRVPVVHPTPKFLKSPPPLPSGTSPRHAPFKETLWTKKKKKENMALIENELLQILNVFNYTDYT